MRKKLAVDICWQRLPHADASLWHPEEAETFKLNNGTLSKPVSQTSTECGPAVDGEHSRGFALKMRF